MDDHSMPSPGDWQPQGPPPPGYYSRFTLYAPEEPPQSPFRDDLYPPRSYGPPPEAFWSPHPHPHHAPFASPPYSPYAEPPSSANRAPPPYWPPMARTASADEGMYPPPPVQRLSGRQAFFPKRSLPPPPTSWPSPPKDDHLNNNNNDRELEEGDEESDRNDNFKDTPAAAHGQFPSSPASRMSVEEHEKSSPSSQATEHTSNIKIDKKRKEGDSLSLLAKTASNIGPPKKRLQKARFDAVGTPLSVSPIPTSGSRLRQEPTTAEDDDASMMNPPKPITPMAGTPYNPTSSHGDNNHPPSGAEMHRPVPPPPQYSHRAYHPSSVFRYEPWQRMEGPMAVCSFDSHDSASRGGPPGPPPPYYYGAGDPYHHYPPPPSDGYHGGPAGPWYPPPPPQQQPPSGQHGSPAASYYGTPPPPPPPPQPSLAAASSSSSATKTESAKSKNGPYTRVQQKGRGDEKHLLRKKFSWKQYPELEQFLVHHRDAYLAHSCKNYSLEQKQYNNWLTHQLIETAERNNLHFDPQEFNFVGIRDRIRCYYKSYVQTARKKGLPLPTELEKSRNFLTSKKPRLEDIEKLPKDDDDSSDDVVAKRETVGRSKKETPVQKSSETTSKESGTNEPTKKPPTHSQASIATSKSAAGKVAQVDEPRAFPSATVKSNENKGATAKVLESKPAGESQKSDSKDNDAAQGTRVTRRMTTRGLTRTSSR